MQKERFKIFVRNHPNLANFVHDKKMTWQQFYELYDLYGEDDKVWGSFLNNSSDRSSTINTSNNTNSSINLVNTLRDFLGLFKGIDLNTVQKTLTSLDKAIEAFKGISFNDRDNNDNRNNYEERPKYKYFED